MLPPDRDFNLEPLLIQSKMGEHSVATVFMYMVVKYHPRM
jgi:hypothetical protein